MIESTKQIAIRCCFEVNIYLIWIKNHLIKIGQETINVTTKRAWWFELNNFQISSSMTNTFPITMEMCYIISFQFIFTNPEGNQSAFTYLRDVLERFTISLWIILVDLGVKLLFRSHPILNMELLKGIVYAIFI